MARRQRRNSSVPLRTRIALRRVSRASDVDDLSDLSGGANVAETDRAASRVRRSRETARSSRRGRRGTLARSLASALGQRSRSEQDGSRARNLVQALMSGRTPEEMQERRDRRETRRQRRQFRRRQEAQEARDSSRRRSVRRNRQAAARRARAQGRGFRTKPLDYEVELRMSGPDIAPRAARRLMREVDRRNRGRIKGPMRYRRTVTRS